MDGGKTYKIIHIKKALKINKCDLYTDLYTLSTAFCAELDEIRDKKTEHSFCVVVIKIDICRKK